MKKLFSLLLFITIVQQTHAQQSLDSLRLVLPMGHVDALKYSDCSKNFKFVMTSDTQFTYLWDAITGKLIKVFNGSNSKFFPGDSSFGTSLGNNFYRYDIYSGEQLYSFECSSRILSFSISPAGEFIIISCEDGYNYAYDERKNELKTIAGGSISFSPDGLYFFVNQKFNVYLYSIIDLKIHRIFPGCSKSAFNKSGNMFCTWSNQSHLSFYNVNNEDTLNSIKLNYTFASDYEMINMDFHPSKNLLLLTGYDGYVGIINLENTQEIWSFSCIEENSEEIYGLLHGISIYAIPALWSPNGNQVLMASSDRAIKIYDCLNKLVKQYPCHLGALTSARFNEKGNFIITTSVDKTAKLIDTYTGDIVVEYIGSNERIKSFSPNINNQLIILSKSKKLQVVNLINCSNDNRILDKSGDVNSAEYNSDGSLIITANQDSSIRIYSSTTLN